MPLGRRTRYADAMTSGKGKRLLAPEALEEAALEVAALAEAEGVHVALIGGLAMQRYGSDRSAGDVDFAADGRIRALPAGSTLSFGAEQTVAPNGVPLDLVLRDDDFAPLYEEAIERATRPGDFPVPVVRAEHLAAMKMVAGRRRDLDDLEFLLATGKVDPREARSIVRKHLGPYAAKELDRVAEEIRLLGASRRGR